MDLGTDYIKSLYNSLWGTKPHINPSEFGEAELELRLDTVLTPISIRSRNKNSNKG